MSPQDTHSTQSMTCVNTQWQAKIFVRQPKNMVEAMSAAQANSTSALSSPDNCWTMRVDLTNIRRTERSLSALVRERVFCDADDGPSDRLLL